MDNYSMIEITIGLVVFGILIVVFWLPTIIAYKNKMPNRLTMGILNAVFGATVIGWLILIIMVTRKGQRFDHIKL